MDAGALTAAGIRIAENDAMAVLRAEAALDWMAENTKLQFDKADAASIVALPACAKLFIVKFGEVINQREGVASESIEGLSQSFATTDKSTLIFQLANSLLSAYMKSQVQVFPAKRRW